MAETQVIAATTPAADTISALIKKSDFVDLGIIKQVLSDTEIIAVRASVTTVREYTPVRCQLLQPAAQNFSIDIKPCINDRVIMLFPKHYNADAFVNVNDTVLDNTTVTYSSLGAVAILYNHLFSDTHRDKVTFEDGAMNLNLAYDIDDKKNKFTFSVASTGSATVSCSSVKINCGNTVISISGDTVTVDNDKAVITLGKDGLISMKNDSTSLYTILKNLIDLLNNGGIKSPSYVMTGGQFAEVAAALPELLKA